jgi:sialic acid synthase SpsE
LVKIQTYEPRDLTLKSFTKGFRVKQGTWKRQYLWNLYKKAHTPFKWHKDAFRLARRKKINLFSTPFSKRGVDLLESFNVPLYKVSSFEIIDHKLIDLIAKTRKPIILSTGLSKTNEIQDAINIIKKYHNKIIILHCISEYPTKLENINFKRIDVLRKKFKNLPLGLSDHTDNIYSSILALSYGVVAIEKHIKISSRSKTIDSSFSISLKKLNELSKIMKSLYMGISSKGDFKYSKSNRSSLIFRKSIFSTKNIKKGEKFSKENIDTFRGLYGLKANNYFKILGKKSKTNIKKNTPIYN